MADETLVHRLVDSRFKTKNTQWKHEVYRHWQPNT